MAEDGSSPAFPKSFSDETEEIKESKSDEQARESLSPIDDDGGTGNEDKDDTSKKPARLDSAEEKTSTEGKETAEVDKDEICETEYKEAEKPSPTKDASTIDGSEKSIEDSTTVTSSTEAGMQDLEDLILERNYGGKLAARTISVAARERNGEEHSLPKEYGNDTTESRDATSITHTAASTAASTEYTNHGNSNNDLAAMIDAAPLAKVVLARRSSSIQYSHHEDPEVGQRFLEAVSVEYQNVIEAKIVALEDIEDSRDRRSWLKRYDIIAVVVLLIAIVILSVALSPRQGEPAYPSKDAPTNNLFENEDAQKLIRIVAPLSGEEVFNDKSPEFSIPHAKALGWLAKDEYLSYDDPSIEWKVRQRYVLALLSTSTTGWKWHESYFFLSKFDECNWSTSSAGVDEHDPFSDRSIFTAHGVICNDNGRVERLLLRWNGLAGTLPHELSEFSSTLSELNFDGGSISGPIPKSFEQLEKLEKLSLQDNCFTGTIPDFSKLRNLHTILLGNNNGLSGSLNEYCIGTERVGNMRNLYADCGNAIECDCCGCCDPDSFECCSEERGCFNTVEMKNGPEDTHIMAFDKVCLSEESKLWIKQECPCYIYQPPGSSVKACTMDCDAKGAIASAADLKSKYDNKP